MKGYKAFEKGMICRGKQYRENTVFEEDAAEICKRGMHFCKNPLDVLDYYPLVDENGNISVFAEVEALGEAKTDDGKKYCTERLKIGSEITFAELVQASTDEGIMKNRDRARIGSSEDYARIGSTGDYARIGSTGDYAQIGSTGYWAQIGSGGDYARIGSTGYRARIGSSGDSARIGSTGDYARIGSTGYRAWIGSTGYWALIGSSGDQARICSSGDRAWIKSSGKNSVICCAGHDCCASAKIGSWITLAEWMVVGTKEYKLKGVRTEYVDGERIKEDTLYKLENGEFVEAEK